MKIKVLIAHNFYRSTIPSGEAQVVEAESKLLSKHGHELAQYFRSNDELVNQGIRGNIKGALSTAWNPYTARDIRVKTEQLKPDVVHVHNTFPLFSPAIFHSIGSRAARVLTLHNYRLFCPAATPARAGRVCTECIDRKTIWPSVKYACYRGSHVATLPVAFGVALHRNLGTWRRQVDAFIVLTEYQRELVVKAGLPGELVHVKPNFHTGTITPTKWEERKQCVVFAGSLSPGKGIETLVRAWIMWGSSAPELRIAGDGELLGKLKQLAADNPLVKIRFLGQIPHDAAQAEIAQSSLLVLPSVSLEGLPLVILEAFAAGTPVAVSDTQPLASIVSDAEDGIVFPSGNIELLLKAVKEAWQSKGQLERLGAGARQSFQSKYTEKINYRKLIGIYERALQVSKSRKHS